MIILSVCLSVRPSVCLSYHLSIHPSICLCLSVCLSVHPSVCVCVFVCVSVCPSVCYRLSTCVSVCILLSIRLSVHLSICLSFRSSICLSSCLSVCLSIHLYVPISAWPPGLAPQAGPTKGCFWGLNFRKVWRKRRSLLPITRTRPRGYLGPKRVIMKEPCKPAQIEVCHRFQAVGCIIPQRRWMKNKGWPMVDSNLHRFSWLWWT